MVDFKKRLEKAAIEKPLDPQLIYERLDRASDKGPLRPAQRAVLEEWHAKRRTAKDVILKLHTGQGKTLIGLLMLQSKLNERDGRALYLCPNKFLAAQTLTQARQFGILAVAADADGELPPEFLDGKAILVVPVQKLFTGLTKFSLGATSLDVDSIVLDDAHACIDSIKEACIINVPREHNAYHEILSLFATDLEDQGVGTFAEIDRRTSSAFLPVPYWAWIDRHREVAAMLARFTDTKEVRFAWPLLRDGLRDCLCVVSGKEIVIAPYLAPLDLFGTYEGATHRIFMSATVTDDSFLVRGLGLTKKVINDPLVYVNEKWSGEKMVLVPSLIDDSLNHTEIVHEFAPSRQTRNVGVVVLTPGFDWTKDWKTEGAIIATPKDIDVQVENLRNGLRSSTLVVANRYDGIDLPDSSCRVLIIDGKPHGATLVDRFVENCRPGSEVIASRTARIVEQGMGRAVRGEKDYCVVLLTGADLVKTVRTRETREYFSQQTRTQIELGMQVSQYAREDVAQGTKPIEALKATINQCLKRDEGWKDFYTERMDKISESGALPRMLDVYVAERDAEQLFKQGDVSRAVETMQALVDGPLIHGDADRGWYLQEMARYRYVDNKAESNKLQVAAHSRNRYLLKPRSGMAISQLVPLSQKRVAAIIDWVSKFESHEALYLAVEEILTRLHFGVSAEPFEAALDALAPAIGFSGERPDKEWKAGPDNLWALKKGDYLLIECKSEVEITRESINKSETGQMNNSSAWFAREYPGADVTRVMIIPTRKVGAAAGFTEDIRVLRARGLKNFTRNVRAFFAEFRGVDLRDLSEAAVLALLLAHHLRIEVILEHAEPVQQLT